MMKPKKGEKGYTLIEMLVGLSIAALVAGAAAATTQTMMRLSPQNSEWAIALRQVQDAGYWISRDVMMSETIDVGDKNPTFLTFTQPQAQPPDRTVVYELQDMPDGLKRMMRIATTDNTTTWLVAEYISTDNTTAVYSEDCTDNCTLTFTITAVSGKTSVTREYTTAQRVPAPEK